MGSFKRDHAMDHIITAIIISTNFLKEALLNNGENMTAP